MVATSSDILETITKDPELKTQACEIIDSVMTDLRSMHTFFSGVNGYNIKNLEHPNYAAQAVLHVIAEKMRS